VVNTSETTCWLAGVTRVELRGADGKWVEPAQTVLDELITV